MATRSRKEMLKYRKYRKTLNPKDNCVFCSPKERGNRTVQETKNFWVLRNIFPYSHWDSQGVSDHLMIVPKVHIVSLSNLKSHEIIEYFELMSSYELQGYNIYARPPISSMKSVVHQHTHLIKLDGVSKKLFLYAKKPYIRIMK